MWLPRRRRNRISLRFGLLSAALVIFIYFVGPWDEIDELKYGGSSKSRANHIFSQGRTGWDKFVKSSFDWGQHLPRYPVASMIPLPEGKPRPIPRVQYSFQPVSPTEFAKSKSRREEVQKTFQRCWNSYREHAWTRDELTPISGKAKDTLGGWAATLIDALDTLLIMDLKDEFTEAVEAVATIDWEKTSETAANIFETTIRHLGGLLAAYDLSHEQVLLVKAVELGDMLYAGFDTPSRMPGFWIDFQKAKSGQLIADLRQPSASPGSLSLEFTRLSQLTGNPKYYEAITRITRLLDDSQNSTRIPGMWPTFINARFGRFDDERDFTIGALADSLYEYLPKMHALLGGLDPIYEKLAKNSLDTIKEKLLFRPMLPEKNDILFAGNAFAGESEIRLDAEGQHLSCFAGGMFALSGRLFKRKDYLDTGAKLTKGCIYAYDAFPSGLMPEIFNMLPCNSVDGCEWDEERWRREGDDTLPKGFKSARARSYILRPEALESVFLMYRITGKSEYQDAAWRMFQAIQNITETEFGNAGIEDVTAVDGGKKIDSMESFWMAETLKYLYLIFSPPELISLDDFVLNTEAHPLTRKIG